MSLVLVTQNVLEVHLYSYVNSTLDYSTVKVDGGLVTHSLSSRYLVCFGFFPCFFLPSKFFMLSKVHIYKDLNYRLKCTMKKISTIDNISVL